MPQAVIPMAGNDSENIMASNNQGNTNQGNQKGGQQKGTENDAGKGLEKKSGSQTPAPKTDKK